MRNVVECFLVVNPGHGEACFPGFGVFQYHLVQKKVVFCTTCFDSTSFLFMPNDDDDDDDDILFVHAQ